MKRLVQIKTEPESKVSFSGIEKKFLIYIVTWLPAFGRYLCVYINNTLSFLWSADTKTEVRKYRMVFPLLLEARRVSEAPMSPQLPVLIYIIYLSNLYIFLSTLPFSVEFMKSATEMNLPWEFSA